jgi:hypothetical protein
VVAAVHRFMAADRARPLLFHSMSFHFSVWELWGALLSGGTAVCVPASVARAPEEMLELLARERIAVDGSGGLGRACPGAGCQLLKASLIFAPACLVSPFTWSPRPSARRRRLPVKRPRSLLARPLAASAVWLDFFATFTSVPFVNRSPGGPSPQGLSLADLPRAYAVGRRVRYAG